MKTELEGLTKEKEKEKAKDAVEKEKNKEEVMHRERCQFKDILEPMDMVAKA